MPENNNQIDDKEYIEFLSEVARDRRDCKLCNHYHYERSDTTEYFTCDKGYFDATDYGGSDYPYINRFGCHGKDFSFDLSSEWWESIYKSNRDSIEEEIGIRIKNKRRERGCEDFKNFILEYFDNSYSNILINSFENLTTWEMRPSLLEELAGADSIAAFSFGFGPEKSEGGGEQYNPKYFHPGKSNEKIASLMQGFWVYTTETRNIKLDNIFAQWEIAEAFSAMYKSAKKKKERLEINPKNIAKPGEEYLGTKGVADFFVEHGLGKFSSVAVFAHPLHMYRCVKTLDKSLKNKGYGTKILIPDTRKVPFDEHSVQLWTTDIRLWILHEINSRAYARSKEDM